jgi:hypothetical protein
MLPALGNLLGAAVVNTAQLLHFAVAGVKFFLW